MRMIENIKRYRPHTSHGIPVQILITVSYALVCLLMLVPYAKYASWVIPLFLLLWEKESDFVLFMEAQLLPVAFFQALLSAIIDFPVQMLEDYCNRSVVFALTLVGDFLGYLVAFISAAVTILPIVVLIIVASRASHYIQTRIIGAGRLAEKILEMERFR